MTKCLLKFILPYISIVALPSSSLPFRLGLELALVGIHVFGKLCTCGVLNPHLSLLLGFSAAPSPLNPFLPEILGNYYEYFTTVLERARGQPWQPGTLPRLPSRDGSSCCYIPQVFVPISQLQSLGTATCGQIGADGIHLLQGHT